MPINNPNALVQQYPIQNQIFQIQQSQLQLQQQQLQQKQGQQQQPQQMHHNQVQIPQQMQHNPQMTQLQMQYHQQGQVPIQAQSQLQLLDGIQHQNQQLAQTQLAIQQQIQRLQIQKDNLSSNNTELENQLQRQLQFQIMELTKLQSQLHITTLPNNISSNGLTPLQHQQILLRQQQQLLHYQQQQQQQQQYPQFQKHLAQQLPPHQMHMIQQGQSQAEQHEHQNEQQNQNRPLNPQLQAQLQLQTEMLMRAQQQGQEFSQVQQQTHILSQAQGEAQAHIQRQIQAQHLRQLQLPTQLQSHSKVNPKEKILRSRNHANLEAVANNHSSKDKTSEKALQQQIINNINENLMSTSDQPGYIHENEIVHKDGLVHASIISDIDHYENFDNVLDYAENVSSNVEHINKPPIEGHNNTDSIINMASMSSHHTDEEFLKFLQQPFGENMEVDENKVANIGSDKLYSQKEEEDILDFLKLMDDPSQLGTQETNQLKLNTNSNRVLNSERFKLGKDTGLGISMFHESLEANIDNQLNNNFMPVNELGQDINSKKSKHNENGHLNSLEVPLTPLNDLYLPSTSPTPISNSMPTLLSDLPASGYNSHNNSITTFDEKNTLMDIIGSGHSNSFIDMSSASSILVPPPTPTSLHNNFRIISPKRSVTSLRSFNDDSPEYSTNLKFLEDFEIDEVEIEGHDSKIRKKCESFTNSSNKAVPKLRKSQSMNAIGLSNKSLRKTEILKSPINPNHGPTTPNSPARIPQTGKSNASLTTSPVVISSYHQPLSSLATRRQSNAGNTLKSKASLKKISLATASATAASTSSSNKRAKDVQAKKNIVSTSSDNSKPTKAKNVNSGEQLARAAATTAASLSQGPSQNNHIRKITITAAAAAALSRSANSAVQLPSKSSSSAAVSAMNSSNSIPSSHPNSLSGNISVSNNSSKSNNKNVFASGNNPVKFKETSSAKSITSQTGSLKSTSSSISSCSSNSSNLNRGQRKFIAFDSESKKSVNGKLKKEMNITSTVTTISSKGNLKPTRIISTSIKRPTKTSNPVKSTSNSVKLLSSTTSNNKSNSSSIDSTTSSSTPSLSVVGNDTQFNRTLSISENPPITKARNSISSIGSNRSSNDSLLGTPTFNSNMKFNSLNFIAENMGTKSNKFHNQTASNKSRFASSTNSTVASGSTSSNGGFSVFTSVSPNVTGNHVFSSQFEMGIRKSGNLASAMGTHDSVAGLDLTAKSNASLDNMNGNFSTFITEPIQIKIRKEREEKLKLQQKQEERKNSVSLRDKKGQNNMVDKKLSSPNLTNTFSSVSLSSPNLESPNHKYSGKQFEFSHKFVNQSIKSNKSISLTSPNLPFSSNFAPTPNNNKSKHSASGSNSSINSAGSTGNLSGTGNNINHTMFKINYTLSGGNDNLKRQDTPDDSSGPSGSFNSVTSSPPSKQVPKTTTGSLYHQMKQNSEFMNSISKFPKEKSSVVPKSYQNINQGLMEFQLDVPNSKK
ncbi:hypothetical protein B5S30_g972 [[Candida] boidinii]|nr:hypothetical protein B5S30_g972 [[Candida] boidinii]GMF99573.1 unnamed protein product [[Candida] boidinii]